jgi:GMP reductase
MENNIALNYKDICLVPNKCIATSRSECSTKIDFLGKSFNLPVAPSNMIAVLNEDIAKQLSFGGYFYIFHRFSNTRKFIQRARAESWPIVSISVGVKKEDRELIKDISESKCRVDFVTIDIANGFSDTVANMIKFIKEHIDTKVIAGNVWGDKASIEFLQNVGADGIKIGLSCGKGCSTFPTTGFGSPMFTAAMEAGIHAKIPCIIDGGVREPADIAKAIVAFTSVQCKPTYGGRPQWNNPINIPVVMAGSIFAACIDSPGELVEKMIHKNNEYYWDNVSKKYEPTLVTKNFKQYFGSASAECKQKTGQEVRNIEGISTEVECNNLTYSEYYDVLTQAIQSQISYSGGNDLSALKNTKWKVIN